jgi:hypothetical protein
LLSPSFVTEIAFAAYTETATFMLDADGICRWVVSAVSTFSKEAESSERCIGAQYVASLDVRAQGGLVELPRVGAPLVFAVVDSTGHVSLIRTGALLRFEVKRKPDSGVHERPIREHALHSVASAHPIAPLTTRDGRDDDERHEEPELATVRFRPAEALRGMLPRRAAKPSPPLPAPPPAAHHPFAPPPPPSPLPAPGMLRGVRPGKLPPLVPPPRRGPPLPETARSPEPKFGGLAPREEEDVRKVPVPAAYWPGRRSGRTRRQA